ncbi:MAG: PorV/PorQ family protein [Ignavibacteriae bacterium]|nr:PorV/PorQ family protein [Ignavibacteriota bacterium]
MKSVYKYIRIPILLFFAASIMYAGGEQRIGTSGSAQLLIPVGARGISMGGASVASTYGVEALHWNPAGAANMNSLVDVTFSHMNYIADIGIEYGAVAAKIEGFGVLSLNIKALSVGEILITTTQDPDGTGATFSPQMLTAGLGYSRLLTDQISVGVVAKFISETLGKVDASGFAFDVGVMYKDLGNINGLSFGIAMKNIGPQMKYDGAGLLIQAESNDLNRPPQYYKTEAAAYELPSSFELGFAYSRSLDNVNMVQLVGNYQNNNFSSDEYKIGGEYNYNNILFIRGGYIMAPDVDAENYIYGLSAGVGLNYEVEGVNLTVDYAFRDVQYFEANHVFQISFGF